METAGLVGVCGEPRSIVEFNANNSILTFESMAIADSIKLIPIGNWLISLYLIFAELQKKKYIYKTTIAAHRTHMGRLHISFLFIHCQCKQSDGMVEHTFSQFRTAVSVVQTMSEKIKLYLESKYLPAHII